MKKVLIIIITLIIIMNIYNKSEETIIPEDAIRFRIIANSNSLEDQNIKIQVRNEVQNKILSIIKDSKSIEETRNLIKSNMNEIDSVVNNKLNELNINQSYNINYGNNYFPNKRYKGITYKDGNYESLVITLGNGEGDNFWCVLFPPLCMVEATDENSSEIEYKFAISEIVNKILKSGQ